MSRPLASVSEFVAIDHPRLAAAQTAELAALCASALAGDDWLAIIDRLAILEPGLRGEIAAGREAILAHRGQVAEAGAKAPFDSVVSGEIRLRAGDVGAAIDLFESRLVCGDGATRARAAAALADALLVAGDPAGARSAVAAAIRGGDTIPAPARAALDVALAAVDLHEGSTVSARAALSRAARCAADDPRLAAVVEIRRAECLLEEGRHGDADRAISRGVALAGIARDALVCASAARVRARLSARAGDSRQAVTALEALIDELRGRGDETCALEAELELCAVLADAGSVARAAAIAGALERAASTLGQVAIARAAALCGLAARVADRDVDGLGASLAEAARDPALATRWQRWARCLDREARGALDVAADDDPIRVALASARAALGRGERAAAQAAITAVAGDADRTALALGGDVLAIAARLALAGDDRARARAAATRALALAEAGGRPRAVCEALLCLAACAEASGDHPGATAAADRALATAADAGLVILRLAAILTGHALAGNADTDASGAPEAATMTAAAIAEASALVGDLGLATERPYRVIDAAGTERRVADPSRLSLAGRTLAIDAVGETLHRDGQVASLRRRSLLKRLLFLFAAAPGHAFSKEAIVEKVWEVAYHPLRHDAALFTNIMRARRLLGDDGADLLRVGEEGYRLCPPADFVFVTRA